ncbi:MAG: glycosyltransferase family 4 protein [Acidobacteria bacterium]|nr:glycosyltransferase family 4 protein [Acidobacteriota bacterium]MBW4044172.1 glycosyltransferase family 4 protein [Acidobacteriota bacterium]
MRVAIIHYWFLVSGGGERVIEVLADMYPDADIFTLFVENKSIPANIDARRIKASFLNKSKLARRMNRALFPVYPLAVESFDLRDYDLIISSDSPPVKGIVTEPHQLHLCYCHTPGRYLWDYYDTFRQTLPWVARPGFSIATEYVRRWDYSAAQRVDGFAANSHFVANRIEKYYNRRSTVIYPPVDTAHSFLSHQPDEYYLHVGRLVASKRVDLMIEACNRLNRKLLIAGTGREEGYLKSLAGKTVEFLGRVPDDQLPNLYANCRALLFPAEEDFGIVPLEAQSYGRPVIAYGKGGSLETIKGHPRESFRSGLFFHEQSVDALCDAMLAFEDVEHLFHPPAIQEHARSFDTSVFIRRMRDFVGSALHDHSSLEAREEGDRAELPRVAS